ncbi:MAG TPA: Crp/Fnr family transcriptional regulator [Xanthobacteraceae bacterium]|nr:Crp/Fnr family transcriptional regulator [Xanthobacteraceae bacterium]
MTNALFHRLGEAAALAPSERTVLEEALRRFRQVPARHDIIRDGERPTDSTVLLEGFACRYKLLSGGRRQILAFLIPGDICDLQLLVMDSMDHSVATLTPCRVASFPRKTIDHLCELSPALLRRLWRETVLDAAIHREWIASLGRRSPYERVAHLFCELTHRLQAIGAVREGRFEFPMTQADLGDAVGLSVVHVNRTLQQMRADGLITLRANVLTILDEARLKAAARFSGDFLGAGVAVAPEQG